MTYRDAFNAYLRKLADQQLSYIESMSDADLVSYTTDHPDFGVRIQAGDKLAYFKCMTAGTPVGSASDLSTWLSQQINATPWDKGIPWDKIL